MEEEAIKIDQEPFELMYGQKKVEKKVIVEVVKSTNEVEKASSQLTGPRQQNINIVLGKVKLKPEDLKKALLSYDKTKLNASVCDLIM